MHPSNDYAWAAGIIDGEGCIGVYVNKHGGAKVCLTVTNTDPRMCVKLQALFGGATRKYNPPAKRQFNTTRDWYYRWQINSFGSVEVAISKLLPYLVCKAEQARLALEFIATKRVLGSPKEVSPETKVLRLELASQVKALKCR